MHNCIFPSLSAVCRIKEMLTIHIFAGCNKFNKDRLKLSDANGDCFGLWPDEIEEGADCIACSQIITCSQHGIIAVRCHSLSVLLFFIWC